MCIYILNMDELDLHTGIQKVCKIPWIYVELCYIWCKYTGKVLGTYEAWECGVCG